MADDRLAKFLEQVGGWSGFEVVNVTLENELLPTRLAGPPRASSPSSRRKPPRLGGVVVAGPR